MNLLGDLLGDASTERKVGHEHLLIFSGLEIGKREKHPKKEEQGAFTPPVADCPDG